VARNRADLRAARRSTARHRNRADATAGPARRDREWREPVRSPRLARCPLPGSSRPQVTIPAAIRRPCFRPLTRGGGAAARPCCWPPRSRRRSRCGALVHGPDPRPGRGLLGRVRNAHARVRPPGVCRRLGHQAPDGLLAALGRGEPGARSGALRGARLTALLAGVACALVFATGRRLGGTVAAVAGAAAFALLDSTGPVKSLAAYSEPLVYVPVAVCAWAIACDRPRALGLPLLLGAATAAATLAKQPALAYAPCAVRGDVACVGHRRRAVEVVAAAGAFLALVGAVSSRSPRRAHGTTS